MQVSISWLEDRPEAYRALCKLWASPEWIVKSKRARECRGFTGGHTYGPDGHIRLVKRLVRKICAKIYSEYIYATSSYPQEAEIGVEPSPVQVYVRGHRPRNPSQPSELCIPMATARLVSCYKTLIGFSLILVLSSLWFASICRRSMGRKWSRVMVKTTIGGKDPLTKWLCMQAEVERPMDGEMLSVFQFCECELQGFILNLCIS